MIVKTKLQILSSNTLQSFFFTFWLIENIYRLIFLRSFITFYNNITVLNYYHRVFCWMKTWLPNLHSPIFSSFLIWFDSAALPVSMSPGATTPLIDGTTTTFFTTEQTTTDTQLTQTLPGMMSSVTQFEEQ